MSPEQAEGFPVDARSDLFSLGAVLYEMLTGRQAFESASIASTLAAVLRSDPLPISRVRTGVPAALARTVVRLLAKDPRARFASAGELKLALGSVSTDTIAAVVHPSKVTPPSIAVLPFANLSADPENEAAIPAIDGRGETSLGILSTSPSRSVNVPLQVIPHPTTSGHPTCPRGRPSSRHSPCPKCPERTA